MPRTKKAQVEPVDVQQDEVKETQPTLTKEEYNKARETIKQYREAQKAKPKRKCSEKQLAALAAGRERNKRFAKKQENTN